MPYLESEQQDETRNVAECDSEKAAVTDAQETTANEQTKPRTKRLRLNSNVFQQCRVRTLVHVDVQLNIVQMNLIMWN
jgi:hypothetical protein